MKLAEIRSMFSTCTGWNNHLPLMWEAILATKGSVIEMGMGNGSTLQLHYLCKHLKRKLYSYETDSSYATEFSSLKAKHHELICIDNNPEAWDAVHTNLAGVSVILIDHGHGHRRHVDLLKLKDFDGVIVCHDTQPPPTGGDYQWQRAWPLFRYKVDVPSPASPNGDSGTWASAVSNTFDVTQWRCKEFGIWKIT